MSSLLVAFLGALAGPSLLLNRAIAAQRPASFQIHVLIHSQSLLSCTLLFPLASFHGEGPGEKTAVEFPNSHGHIFCGVCILLVSTCGLSRIVLLKEATCDPVKDGS